MFQDKYDLSEIKNFIQTDIDIILRGSRNDERSNYLKDSITEFKGTFVSMEVDHGCEYLDIKMENASNGDIQSINKKALLPGVRSFLKDMEIEQKNVVLDITGMHHVIMFILTKVLLTETNPRLLFASYTEPENYIREQSDFSDFVLSENFMDMKAVPGFSKYDRGNDRILVPLLGFEGHRLISLLEDTQQIPKKIIPIVGFPSYSPGWKSITIGSNGRALTTYDCFGQIHTCEAASPYRAYKLLQSISKLNEGDELLVAPLGTRPHALGAAIYACLSNSCTLVYDFPIEKMQRSVGCSKSYIYNLSRFISESIDG